MTNDRIDMNIRNFELLPVSEILKVQEDRLKYISDSANFIINYQQNIMDNNQRMRRYKTDYNMMLGYGIASRLSSNIQDNRLFFPQAHREFYFENSGEKSLFAMLLVDSECNYFKLYQEKLNEGMSSAEVMDLLKIYYGFKSAKLIQIERYYLALLSKYEKKKEKPNIGIFEVIEDDKSPVK